MRTLQEAPAGLASPGRFEHRTQLGAPDPRKPHQHRRVVQVVVVEEKCVGLLAQKSLTLLEPAAQREGHAIFLEAGEEAALDLERRRAIGKAFLDAGQGAGDRHDRVEGGPCSLRSLSR